MNTMPTFNVTIRATVTKTYKVEADTKDEAVETAHEGFSVLNGDVDEQYKEEMLDVTEIPHL